MGADPTGGNSSSFSFDGARSFYAIIISLATLCFHFERVYVRRVTPVLSILKTTANLSRHDPDPRRFRRGYDALAQLFQRRLRGVLFFYFRNFVHVFQRNRPLDFVPWPLPPPATPAAFLTKYVTGGVRISHSKDLSLYAVMTTGMGASELKSAVLALKALQNSMMFSPCCPNAGPTGGAGLAAPAEIISLIFARTGRDIAK